MGLFHLVGNLVTAFVSAPIYALAPTWDGSLWRQGPLPNKRVCFDAGIETLVVVAGVSGSGKSTFIKQLLSQRLCDEITSHLPRDVSCWSFIGEKIPRAKRYFSVPANRPDAQIVHYEITQAYIPKPDADHLPPAPDDYWACEDIGFMRMLSAARQIYLVVVEAPGEQVACQLSTRSSLLHVPTLLRPLFALCGSRLQAIEARLPNWLSNWAGRMLGRRWRHRALIRARNDRLIELYRRPFALENIYREWPRTMQEAWGKRIVGALRVRPSADASGRARFIICESAFD